MAADLPTTLSYRFGIRTYELSDQDLLYPGQLVDKLVEVKDVCRAGAFVGRLKDGPSPCNTRDNVERVKEFLRSGKECQKAVDLCQRMHLPGENRAFLIHSSGEGENESQQRFINTLRKNFMKKVLAHNFEKAPKSKLESVMDSGVANFLDSLLERLTDSEPIMYAQNIDLQPTLATTVSVKLSSMMSNIQNLAGCRRVGIVSPTVYIGTEASTFNCHREDAAFEGVNRHVAGSPKIWFTVAPRFYNAFCLLLNKLRLPADDRLCSVYLQHKFVWIDPRIVMKYGIPVRLIIQRPGDIVFVLSNTIHWGVNLGFNINEAVNIASDTWAKPGMMCPPRCQCETVAGLYFRFDLTPMLRIIGISKDTISKYEQGDVMQMSLELRFMHPDLHPEMGVPDSSAINVEHLLGPEADWDQLVKTPKPFICQVQEGFVGGFQCVGWSGEEDSEDTLMIGYVEEECKDMDGNSCAAAYPRKNETAAPLDVDGSVASGTYKCPSCGKDTKRYGERGMTALRCHITSQHTEHQEKLLQLVHNMYCRSSRNFSSPSLICDLCGKTVRGSITHVIRHKQSRNCNPLPGKKRKESLS